MHVIVPTMLKQTFDFVFKVNKTYTIVNFQVHINELLFGPSEHKYVLKFTHGTIVRDNNKHVIPDMPMKFMSFGKIISRKW